MVSAIALGGGAACGLDDQDPPPEGSGGGPGEQGQADERSPSPQGPTGTIKGRVTDGRTRKPLADVYLTVGYKGAQLAAKTDEKGRYTVPDVPADAPAPVFGFREGGYRYNNSSFNDKLDIRVEPDETYTYDFQLQPLDERGGEPRISKPSIAPARVRPGQEVTVRLDVPRGGRGGLSDEVFAASPKLGRLALLDGRVGGTFTASLTVPPDTPPGDYPVAFFAASNEGLNPRRFPTRTLRVEPMP